jgi:hypothetical protein
LVIIIGSLDNTRVGRGTIVPLDSVERGDGSILRPIAQFRVDRRHVRWLRLFAVLVMVLAPWGLTGHSANAAHMSYQEDAATGQEVLEITFDEDGYELPAAVDPGWYIVTLNNTTDTDVVADLVMLPPDRAVEDLQQAVTTDSGGSTVPDWFEQVTFAGGPWAKAQATGQTFVPLTTGTWHVLQVGNAKSPVAELTVNDGPAPGESPIEDQGVDVAMSPGSFTMPGELLTGNRIWRVTNSDTLTHAFALVFLPSEMNYDEMLKMLQTGEVPEDILLDQTVVVGGIGLLSGGRTIFIAFDLNPGYYVALDYVPIKDGRTFAELGQFAIFTVKEPDPQ